MTEFWSEITVLFQNSISHSQHPHRETNITFNYIPNMDVRNEIFKNYKEKT